MKIKIQLQFHPYLMLSFRNQHDALDFRYHAAEQMVICANQFRQAFQFQQVEWKHEAHVEYQQLIQHLLRDNQAVKSKNNEQT